jgi:SAM-dependent methyltransferase
MGPRSKSAIGSATVIYSRAVTRYEDEVKGYYEGQAERFGLSPESTLADQVIRAKEIEALLATVAAIASPPGKQNRQPRILEIGCGNGTLLEQLWEAGYTEVVGTDYLADFVTLASSRSLPFEIRQADVRALPFGAGEFDVVLSERVVINLKDPAHQREAVQEIRRVLRPGGHVVLIEAFEDGWRNLNEARGELGLDPIPMPSQNRWFKPGELEEFAKDGFVAVSEIAGRPLPARNFLSTHYFVARVVHALLLELREARSDGFKGPVRNTHFVRMLGSALPVAGNYAPLQYLCLRAI